MSTGEKKGEQIAIDEAISASNIETIRRLISVTLSHLYSFISGGRRVSFFLFKALYWNNKKGSCPNA